MFQFVGSWEGTLNAFNGPNFIDATGLSGSFRIVIDANNSVAVFYRKKNGDSEEAKRGSFALSTWGSQAVVWAIDSGHDQDGTWVEGWTFCLVHLDGDTLVAYWLRNVNNLDIARTDSNYHFAYGYSGQMHRVTGPGQ